MRRTMLCAVLCSTLALAAPPKAPKPPAPTPSAPNLDVPVENYKLDNGLQVLLSEDHRLPVVAVDIWYHVGGLNEHPGRTGFAHLFEHMMFQGSAHVADDEHLQLLEKLGASDLNGTTDFDRTNYFETVPSNQFETALWLESDRMGFLLDALTQKRLDTQREVVKNERRQSFETRPYGLAEEKQWQALFPAPHPYFGNVIGSMKDLDAATVDDVKGFFKTYYAPANATLAIVGDFDRAQAKAWVQKYFGSLPSTPQPPVPEIKTAPLTQAVVIHHQETVATLPAVFMAWHTPSSFQPGDADADILSSILASGEASRLQRKLVRELQLAQSVSAHQQSLQAQSVFSVTAIARPGVDPEKLGQEVDKVLADVRDHGALPDEVQEAKNRIETAMVAGLQQVGGFGGKADILQTYNHYLGEPNRLAWDLQRYEAVTPQSVQALAKTYLKPDARVILYAEPQSQKGPSKPVTQEVR